MTLLLEADTLAKVTATHHQIPMPAMPPPGPYRTARRSPSSAIALVVVGLIATAALIVGIVGLTRGNSAPAIAPPSAPEAPTYSAAESATARQKVCTVFEQTSQAVNTATSAPAGPEPVAISSNARAAVVSAALALTRAIGPATPADVAEKANALADAYSDYIVNAFAEKKSDQAPIMTARTALREACA